MNAIISSGLYVFIHMAYVWFIDLFTISSFETYLFCVESLAVSNNHCSLWLMWLVAST